MILRERVRGAPARIAEACARVWAARRYTSPPPGHVTRSLVAPTTTRLPLRGTSLCAVGSNRMLKRIIAAHEKE